SPYLYAMMIVQAGVSILLPLNIVQVLMLNLLTIAVALVPLVLKPIPPEQLPIFLSAASYLGCMAVVSVAGAVAQDRLRRREYQARAEFARHFGLLNLGTLAGGLAHELSNPLNALTMQVELLARDPASLDKRIEKLR